MSSNPHSETHSSNTPEAEPAKSVVSVAVVDAAVAVLVMVLGGVVLYGSRKLGSEWTTDGPGAGYFPFYIGIILLISGLGVLYQSFNNPKAKQEIFVDRVQIVRVLQVLIPAVVYVGIVQLLGLYVASAIYIALFMVVLGKYSWIKSLVAALAVNITFFFMFEVWFKVPLFKGTLDLLSGLGY
ncbi:MAG: tripartite tricarboxylate transporter TctB family protein [Betaproteobacteria bacterium]|nr:tripartite tricarboxylate transporter TctB family protein [Betaproteobacteria bacterium]NBY70834.1 tripartite tricarboxylate transporter TctB family protein [Betaproteobacteria bacterium]